MKSTISIDWILELSLEYFRTEVNVDVDNLGLSFYFKWYWTPL